MAERPQVRTDFGQPELVRTTARPMRERAPVHSLKQSRAGALAKSLVSIAPALHGFIEEAEQDYKVDEENRAYDEIQGMTFDEAQRRVKSGEMRQTESPWFQAAFEKQFGTVYANRRKRELVDAYNNEFDKHNGDLDSFIAEFAGSDLEKFGGSDFIMSGYREGMQGVLPELRNQHAEWQSQWTRERVSEGFGSIVYDAVGTAVENGDDLNQVLGLLKGDHRESFGMTFKEMDGHIFSVAGRFAAEGNVEAAEAILSTEMVGPDGTVIGSYMNRPQYAEKATELLETAKATRGSERRDENTATVVALKDGAATGNLDTDLALELYEQEQISRAEYENLLRQNNASVRRNTAKAEVQQFEDGIRTEAFKQIVAGNAYAIQDVTYTDAEGKERTVTRETLVDDAVTDVMNQMADKQTPPAIMAEELSSFGVDTTYPVWENLMSDGYLTLTENLAAEDKDGNVQIPETAFKAYATYKALGETPNLRSRHINNPDAERVWQTAELFEEMGYDPKDALMTAARPPSPGGLAIANRLSRQEITSIANLVKGGVFDGDPVNGSLAINKIERLSKAFVAQGATVKAAVKQAIKDYEGSHTNINGVYVNTRNAYLPPNFEDASLVALQNFAEAADEDVDDITLIPAHDKSNTWVVVNRETRMPVQTVTADTRLHISEIERSYAQAQEEIVDETRAVVEAEIAAEKQRQAAMLKRENNRRKRAGQPALTMEQLLAEQEKKRREEEEAAATRMERALEGVNEAERLRLGDRAQPSELPDEGDEEPSWATGSRARRNNR